MPKNFRKEFRTAGCTAHITKRRSGKDNWNYMIRYRKNGYNLLASSNNLEEAKRKFIEKLKEADAIKRTEDLGYMVVPIMPYTNQQAVGATTQPQVIGAYIVPQQTLAATAIQPQVVTNPVQQPQPQEQPEKVNGIPATFDKFSNYYFENFHIRKVTPMLKPYLEGVEKLHFVRLEQMRNRMKQILPDHKLYDMRTTFYTRCSECGIAEVALKKYVGHSLGGLADTYTDLSDEFLLREGQKLNY